MEKDVADEQVRTPDERTAVPPRLGGRRASRDPWTSAVAPRRCRRHLHDFLALGQLPPSKLARQEKRPCTSAWRGSQACTAVTCSAMPGRAGRRWAPAVPAFGIRTRARIPAVAGSSYTVAAVSPRRQGLAASPGAAPASLPGRPGARPAAGGRGRAPGMAPHECLVGAEITYRSSGAWGGDALLVRVALSGMAGMPVVIPQGPRPPGHGCSVPKPQQGRRSDKQRPAPQSAAPRTLAMAGGAR
jgi:hypothetical protein